MSISRKCSIIILNYNGLALLKECVPAIVKAAGYNDAHHQIIVIDNNSTDDSCAYLKQYHPEITLMQSLRNDYLFSYNDVVKNCKHDYVILLNNDIMPEEDFAYHLLRHFEKKDVFAVTGKFLRWDRRTLDCSRVSGTFEKGWLYQNILEDVPSTSYTLYASGACMAIDKEKFIALQGFDTLFRPYFFEETDICYRAWKKGWKSIYEPEALLYHKRSATINTFYRKREADIILKKNQFLFVWKNVSDKNILLWNIVSCIKKYLRSVLEKDTVYIQSLSRALRQLPEVIAYRLKSFLNTHTYTDQHIIRLSRQTVNEENK